MVLLRRKQTATRLILYVNNMNSNTDKTYQGIEIGRCD